MHSAFKALISGYRSLYVDLCMAARESGENEKGTALGICCILVGVCLSPLCTLFFPNVVQVTRLYTVGQIDQAKDWHSFQSQYV